MGAKGQPKTIGSGRKAGTPNKVTTALREAILAAADEAHAEGKVGYLKWLATNNSGAFAGLLGKVLPTTLAGDSDNPLSLEAKVALTTDAERLAAIASLMAKAKGS